VLPDVHGVSEIESPVVIRYTGKKYYTEFGPLELASPITVQFPKAIYNKSILDNGQYPT
jgi:hypothetical protein